MGDQQFLDGLPLADSGIKDGLHVQLLQVLMLLVPPARKGCVYIGCTNVQRECTVRVGARPTGASVILS